MRVVLSVRCSLSLCVCCSHCVLPSACYCITSAYSALSLCVALYAALSACRSFCVLLASSDSLDCLSRSALHFGTLSRIEMPLHELLWLPGGWLNQSPISCPISVSGPFVVACPEHATCRASPESVTIRLPH